jgi:hypothetical protein
MATLHADIISSLKLIHASCMIRVGDEILPIGEICCRAVAEIEKRDRLINTLKQELFFKQEK